MGRAALPYLDIMGSKTLAATTGRVIRRDWRVFISRAPSIITTGFEDTGPDYTLAPSHRPLAKHREKFSVLLSLLHIQGRISGHEHPYNWLTGTNIKQTPGTVTNTISMDQVAAKYAGPTCAVAGVVVRQWRGYNHAVAQRDGRGYPGHGGLSGGVQPALSAGGQGADPGPRNASR